MRYERRLRRLVVDERTVFVWNVRHRHGGGEPCSEVRSLHRDGAVTRIVFREGEGRGIADGYLPSGCVCTNDGVLNLHEPGVVRAFVDEARRRGLLAGSAEVDGWELFASVVVRCAAAATPGVPPDCPPGP
ncbi:hypothetical protein [Streptomyces sp. HUAS ZL42]|uniref:hypothetical protein n=1 Tax=Streptomyces sp. HUAS ZL42 TaxID=3231715 RepID=UPI00345E1E24